MPAVSSHSHSSGLVLCDDATLWDEFCDASPEGTPFMQSWFTNATSESASRYFWQENSRPLAAILIPLENDTPTRQKFSVYQSICYSCELEKLPEAEKTRKRYAILDSVIESLTKKYKSLYFSLHPGIVDIRPILWHNYNTPEEGTFKIDVRYTALRSLAEINSIENILLDIRSDRRADYKKSIKANVKITSEVNSKEFLDLYEMTFNKQNIEIDDRSLSIVDNIVNSVSDKRGFVLTARTENQTPISATVILTNRSSAYSLFTVNNPEFRKAGANTALVVAAMLHAKKLGKAEFDFIGANSPNRGDFKLSFNSCLRSYFECKKS